MGRMETLERAEAIERGLMDIGQAAKRSSVSAKMIRHYEAVGLLPKVARTFANYRIYTENDVHTLRFIKRARTLGFSVKQIESLLALWQDRTRASREVKRIALAHVEELQARIREMEEMKRTLERLAADCHGDHRPQCPILDDLGTPDAGAPSPGAKPLLHRNRRLAPGRTRAPRG